MNTDKVRKAEQRLIAATSDADWLESAGIGMVGSEIGLVVSVAKDTKAVAQQELAKLHLDVPIQLREIERVRARTARGRA
jgi:hypothetical protein